MKYILILILILSLASCTKYIRLGYLTIDYRAKSFNLPCDGLHVNSNINGPPLPGYARGITMRGYANDTNSPLTGLQLNITGYNQSGVYYFDSNTVLHIFSIRPYQYYWTSFISMQSSHVSVQINGDNASLDFTTTVYNLYNPNDSFPISGTFTGVVAWH